MPFGRKSIWINIWEHLRILKKNIWYFVNVEVWQKNSDVPNTNFIEYWPHRMPRYHCIWMCLEFLDLQIVICLSAIHNSAGFILRVGKKIFKTV